MFLWILEIKSEQNNFLVDMISFNTKIGQMEIYPIEYKILFKNMNL